jgi:isoquinoline 1-oxidoreductase beta subunit
VIGPTLSRRSFLQASAVAGGLVLTLKLVPGKGARGSDGQASGTFAPNAFIRIASDGKVTLIVEKAEVGQGVYTSMPMLMAEELEVDLGQVAIEAAPPDERQYADPILHFQATGNSTSVRANWQRLREAGAACRMMLVEAAAQRWHVPAEECRAELGQVLHTASGRKLRYGQLAGAAAHLPVPERISLKHNGQFKLIGTSPLRLDLPGKVNGRLQYGIDVRLPGMKFATIKSCPVFGGRLARVADEKARAIPGVMKVVRLDDAVAVIADSTWIAMQGLGALDIEWIAGPHASVTMQDIVRGLNEAAQGNGILAHQEGDAPGAYANAARKIESHYEMPFLAHAPMEPVNCVAWVHDGGCEIWTSTQVQVRAQAAAAAASGVPPEKVTLHNLVAGGAFGRRLEVDFISLAARIAREVNMPVNVTWSREEDIQRDMYRPYYLDRMQAGLAENGRIVAWRHRITGSSVMARFAPPALGPNGLDPDAVDCAAQPIYDFPNFRVDYARCEPPGVPTAFWRGVGPTHNVFVMESFIDECAAAARQDPVSYRRAMLQHSPRALRTLNLAVEKSGWQQKLPPRSGRGIAVVYVFDTYLTVVAQVAVSPDGQVRMERVVCAVDCGTVVHPDNCAAQIEGGVLFGLSAALFSEITIEGGRTVQSNFHDYRTLRMSEVPRVEVHLAPSGDAPGGIGETGTIGAAPALANAIFAATGIRIRKLPVKGIDLKQA